MVNPDIIIGIDPGKGGGIAYWKAGIVKTVRMPMDAKEMQNYLKYLKTIGRFSAVFIEKLSFRNNNRKIPGLDYQIQKLLNHYERLCTTLELTDILYFQIPPVTWQTYLHLKLKKKEGEEEESHDDRKRRYRDVAQVYYPVIKSTLWNCDALLLIEFGRRKFQFDESWIKDNLPAKYKVNDDLGILQNKGI